MKKIKVILVVTVVLMYGLFSKSSVAEAKTQLRVQKSGISVSVLSEKELLELTGTMRQEGISGQLGQAQETRSGSYTAYRYTETFDFYKEDLRIARAAVECIVWEYTDGKVHLYSRTITPSRIMNYEIYRTYGRIVNTDGSLSYTTGDSVNISSFVEEWDYAIEFRITPSDYSFSCYQI